MTKSDLIVVLVGFVVINAASLLIAARVKKYWQARYAPFTFLFVLLLAVYYFVDVLRQGGALLSNYYFYLWILVMAVQAGLFILSLQKQKKTRQF